MKIIKGALAVSVFLLFLLGFTAYFSPSKPLSLVKDIGQLPVDTTIDGEKIIVFKENLYFLKDTPQTGKELWRVDKFNNVNLAFETIPGRDSATTKALFESDGILYLVIQKPNDYSSLIYYLEEPDGDFVEIDPNMHVNTDKLESFNGKYFSLSEDNTIIEFDGANTKYHIETGTNWSYSIEDFTYFNNELYYSFSDDPLRELRKITGETAETVYSSVHTITFLFSTVDGIYFIESNYDTSPRSYDLSLLKDNQVFPLESFSQINFGSSQVVGERLIIDGTTVGSEIRQLWEFKGTENKQITEYQEQNHLRIEDITAEQEGLYFVEIGPDGEKIKYHDGVSLNDVSLNYDHLEGLDHILKLNGDLLIEGTEYHESGSRKGISVLNNGIATEVLSGNNTSYFELFEIADEIYALSSVNTSEVELYRINAADKTSELRITFNGEYAGYVAADSVNQRIYLTYREPGEFGAPLSVIEGSSVEKLYVTDATGSGNPRNYTAVKDKTYFIAKHDEYGDTIWESDGYDAHLVEGAFNESPELTPEKLFNINDHLFFVMKETNTAYSQFWLLEDGNPKRLSQNSFSYIESSILNEGSQLYMVAGFNGTSVNKLLSIKPDKIEYINELEFVATDLEFIKTPHGIFFTTGYDEYTQVWQIDNSSLLEINKNETVFTASHHREILWDAGNVYVKECINEYDTALYRINSDNKLEDVDLAELSGKRCSNIWFNQLDNETVISLIDHSSSSLGFWTLNDGKVVKLGSLGIPFDIKFVSQNSRLYFNAKPLGAPQSYLYVYEDGEVKNLNLGRIGKLKIAKGAKDDNIDWLFYEEQHSVNGYQLYEYDGSSLSLHNSIPSEYRDVYKMVTVGNINFIQVGNSGGDNELIALDEKGVLSYLNSDQSINFSIGGSHNEENLMANGHGKWLFLQGCNYIVGCEPYSLNLNQLPTAGFTTDKNHYVAGYEVLVDGSSSVDPENNIIEYNWKIVGYEGALVENNGADQAAITLPLVEQDTDLTIELEIVDDGYDRSVATNTISVEVNHAPEVVINAPSSAVEGSFVELNANGSSDVEGEELGFQWRIVEGENITLNNANQAIASFTVPNIEEESDITIKVSVSDAVGNISHAEVTISLKVSEGEGNPDPDSGSSSGGGGSTGWLLILLLFAVYWRKTSLR